MQKFVTEDYDPTQEPGQHLKTTTVYFMIVFFVFFVICYQKINFNFLFFFYFLFFLFYNPALYAALFSFSFSLCPHETRAALDLRLWHGTWYFLSSRPKNLVLFKL